MQLKSTRAEQTVAFSSSIRNRDSEKQYLKRRLKMKCMNSQKARQLLRYCRICDQNHENRLISENCLPWKRYKIRILILSKFAKKEIFYRCDRTTWVAGHVLSILLCEMRPFNKIHTKERKEYKMKILKENMSKDSLVHIAIIGQFKIIKELYYDSC